VNESRDQRVLNVLHDLDTADRLVTEGTTPVDRVSVFEVALLLGLARIGDELLALERHARPTRSHRAKQKGRS
jgi:hypothetical protein